MTAGSCVRFQPTGGEIPSSSRHLAAALVSGPFYPFASHRAVASIAARSTVSACNWNPKYSRVPRGPVYDAGNGPSRARWHAEQPGKAPLARERDHARRPTGGRRRPESRWFAPFSVLRVAFENVANALGRHCLADPDWDNSVGHSEPNAIVEVPRSIQIRPDAAEPPAPQAV